MLPSVTEAYCESLDTSSGMHWWYDISEATSETTRFRFYLSFRL